MVHLRITNVKLYILAVADMNYKLGMLSYDLHRTRSLQIDLGNAQKSLGGEIKVSLP